MARVVLLGGGHAHVPLLHAIPKLIELGHRVSVVAPWETHFYSGMGPGLLGGMYEPADLVFPVRRLTEAYGGRFVSARAVLVDPGERRVHLDNGDELSFDVLSVNTGSSVPTSLLNTDFDHLYPSKPIRELIAAREELCELAASLGRPVRVGVIGGGPAAIEIAANAWVAAEEASGTPPELCLYTGRSPMPSFNRHARRIVSKAFRERGIETYSGSYASEVVQGEIRIDDGHRRVFDLVFLATGVRPGSLYADSGLPTGPLGGLRVDKHLQSVGGEPIFGGGDCISFAPRALQRAGVYSVRQAPVLRDNVFAFLSGSRLREFKPGGSYALILNLGGGRAVFHRGPVAFDGRWAMLIKDRIDRRFMSTVATEDLRRTVT